MTMPATRVQEGQFWQCLATRSAGQPLCGIGKSTSQLQLDLKKQRNALLSSLRGQTIRIPDLKPLFQHWPTKTNPDLDHLRTEVNDWLKRWETLLSGHHTVADHQTQVPYRQVSTSTHSRPLILDSLARRGGLAQNSASFRLLPISQCGFSRGTMRST
jgi:hypothetical protein